MKKVHKSLGKHLLPLKLYLDDIEEIIYKIKNMCHSEKIKFISNEYEFVSIDEIKEHYGDVVKELSITAYNPYFSIDIKRTSVWLYTSGENEAAFGLWYNIKDYLNRKINIFSKIFNIWIFLNLSIIILLPLSTIISSNKVSNLFKLQAIIVFIISLCFLFLSTVKYILGSRIILKRKSKVQNFWKRNSDKIILSIINFIIGGVIGGVIGYFLKEILQLIF